MLHHIQYYLNNFISSPEGKQLADNMSLSDFPELQKALQDQTKLHSDIMNKINTKKD